MTQFLYPSFFFLPSGALRVPCHMIPSTSNAFLDRFCAYYGGMFSAAPSTGFFPSTSYCMMTKPPTLVALSYLKLRSVSNCREQMIVQIQPLTYDAVSDFSAVKEDNDRAAFCSLIWFEIATQRTNLSNGEVAIAILFLNSFHDWFRSVSGVESI